VLVQKDGEVEKPVDVDGLYDALKINMIKLLAQDTGSPEQEFVNSELIDLMEKIESLVISRVTDIKMRPEKVILQYEEIRNEHISTKN